MTLYKVLAEDGSACNGGHSKWSLPTKNEDGTWTPGDWMPAIEGDLVSCENGYHLCEDAQVLEWLGPALFEAEYRGDGVYGLDKIVVREARLLRRFENWNERTARLFACDCAERVVHLCGDEPRPAAAIAVARRYADGKASKEELAAARDTAWVAARGGVGDAARIAADAATQAATQYALGDAASAAGLVARDTSRAASRAAGYAAEDATWDDWVAARAAEKDWQYAKLVEYLGEARWATLTRFSA